MSVYALERDNLSPLNPSAENKLPQPFESRIYDRNHLVEFTGNLQTSEGLQKAGWDSFAEIKRFIGDINLGLIKGLTLEEAVAASTKVFTDHIRFHDAEFARQESLLPHHNYFGDWQGERRWLGNNGRPVVHGIDETERMGVPKRAAQKTETLLLEAENNSLVVSISTQGPSGYFDENGCDVPHLNTLVLADYKDKQGNLEGATFVTDLTVEQAEQLMVLLGTRANFLAGRESEMQRVANILENPVLLSLPERYHNPLEFVIDQIVAIRGEEDIHLRQKKGPDEIRSIAQLRQKIANLGSLLDLNVTKDRLIAELQEFILVNFQQVESPSFQQEIVNMAEDTVSLFARYYRKYNQRDTLSNSVDTLTQFANHSTVDDKEIVRPQKGVDRREFFAAEIAFLQSRSGCPNSRNSLAGKSGIAGVSIFGESDSMGSLYFPCPLCGAINKRPWEGYVRNCQSCGTDKVSCGSSGGAKKEDQDKDFKIIAFPVSPNKSVQKAA